MSTFSCNRKYESESDYTDSVDDGETEVDNDAGDEGDCDHGLDKLQYVNFNMLLQLISILL